jgi:hypothetical protein
MRRLPQRHDHPARDQGDDARQQDDEHHPGADDRGLDEAQRLLLLDEREEVVELVMTGDRHPHRERGPRGLAIGAHQFGRCVVQPV